MDIRKAEMNELNAAVELAMHLWPDGERQERLDELKVLVTGPESVIFLAWDGEIPAAYAQCQLRHDYVEGCDSSPVGYLEGVYVEPAYRGSGLAAQMLEKCQQWSRERGCTEFASDCELENGASLRFHMKNGFEEAGRIICFVKKL
ncbi:MAG: GNAT family N-acetyltransferase [Clostridiales bacterium]|nr:GNAT family N-acetyltransferase [Clostridiales bacterium]